jgi:hypothetical protein
VRQRPVSLLYRKENEKLNSAPANGSSKLDAVKDECKYGMSEIGLFGFLEYRFSVQ